MREKTLTLQKSQTLYIQGDKYLNLLCFYTCAKNYYLNKFLNHSYHIEDALVLNYYKTILKKKHINLVLRPEGQGQNVFLCKQNRSFSSLQFKQLHIIYYQIHTMCYRSALQVVWLRMDSQALAICTAARGKGCLNRLQECLGNLYYIHGNECRVTICTVEDPPSHTWVCGWHLPELKSFLLWDYIHRDCFCF